MYSDASQLLLHREWVQTDWIDNNAHMNEAYFLLVFSHATGAMMDLIGLDVARRRWTGRSMYARETHISYLHEASEGDPLAVRTQILNLDEKRLRIFHLMEHGETGLPLATAEMMLISVDTIGPRAAPFSPEVRSRLDRILEAQRHLPRPKEAGRAVSMRA